MKSVSGEVVHHSGQFRFLIGCLFPVDNVLFGQFIDHTGHFLQQGAGLILCGGAFQPFDCSPGGFVLIPVSQALRFVGAYPLLC